MQMEAAVDTVSAHIDITPGVCGGKPRITGHRITVQDIAAWHERLEMGADEIASEYSLTLGDVYAALSYYYDHREEIDRAMQADRDLVERLRQGLPSKIARAPVD